MKVALKMSMKKILIITPYERDANSYWRCMGPMTYLANHSNDQIRITLQPPGEAVAWCEVMQYDLLFFHRPCRPDDLTIMKIAHNCGIPTWVDYDDWLFNIPAWNKTSANYHNPGVQNVMAQCLASADMISCTTQELHDRFKLVNPNVTIIPNAYRSDLHTFRADVPPPRNPVCYWRGSDTHDGDLLSVKEGFKELHSKVLFIGGVSWMLTSHMEPKSFQTLNGQDVIMFFQMIYDLSAKVCVFPLVDCFFNRCKSNICYIEAMHAGAICVAPDMPEWRKEGVITYEPHNSDDFRSTINTALAMPEDVHKKIVASAFETMKREYDISVVNQSRVQIAHDLTKDTTRPSPFDQMAAMNALSIFKGENSGENFRFS